ncbi:MAG: hypothetical protein F6J90_24235 [Moorea sp. SIOASIH]|uniref:hypothetical protein n=1 Tax=Moorena sp. SIOASIH TaxID=2607817 RepID=UPI0013BD2411|nr:hypothetical protein [Moorena sp. SIOASIH]NEO39276.1 hypothetical protein [Moorena sp. SIOASIH]
MMPIQPHLSLPLNVSIQLSAPQVSAFSFQPCPWPKGHATGMATLLEVLSGISYQLMRPMRRSLCHATDCAFE